MEDTREGRRGPVSFEERAQRLAALLREAGPTGTLANSDATDGGDAPSDIYRG